MSEYVSECAERQSLWSYPANEICTPDNGNGAPK